MSTKRGEKQPLEGYVPLLLAAQDLGVSRETLYSAIARQRLPAISRITLNNRWWFVKMADVEQYLEETRQYRERRQHAQQNSQALDRAKLRAQILEEMRSNAPTP